jgi:hypothetical protein
MAHTMVTFRLHRRGVILLVVFCVILAVLIFVAGYLAGSRRGGAPPAAVPPAPRRPGASGTAGGAPAPQKKPATRTEPRESLTLRVAVFTSEEDAKAQVASLTAQGLKPTIIQMPTSAGVMLHNVCVGQFETRSAANAAAKELQRRLGYLPVVIPAPPPSNL